MPVYDELYKFKDQLHVLVRHEQGLLHKGTQNSRKSRWPLQLRDQEQQIWLSADANRFDSMVLHDRSS
jgi:hypothetical protein